jgi:hypothetical protein
MVDTGPKYNSECAGQHIPIFRFRTDAAILGRFQGLVKVQRGPAVPTNTGQHNPIKATTDEDQGQARKKFLILISLLHPVVRLPQKKMGTDLFS